MYSMNVRKFDSVTMGARPTPFVDEIRKYASMSSDFAKGLMRGITVVESSLIPDDEWWAAESTDVVLASSAAVTRVKFDAWMARLEDRNV